MPSFLWLSQEANLAGGPISNGPERREVAAARGHLSAAAHLYNLTPTDVKSAVVSTVFNTGRGPVIVKFMQSVAGIEVFREELNVVMTQGLEPIALTGYITSQTTPSAIPGRSTWDVQPRNAAVNALQDSTARNFSVGQLTAAFSRDGYEFYNVSGDAGVSVEPVRMKKVWFHLQDGLVPAYYVEAISSPVLTDAHIGSVEDSAYAYVISATDGAILFRKNLISEAVNGKEAGALPAGGFTYRVWADPVTGIPYDTPAGNGVHPKVVPTPDGAQHPFVPTQDVTLPNFPFSMNDPWLAPGATETNGNNVDAFVNIFSPDGLGNPITTTPTDPPNGDHRAQITGVDQFLHNHAPDVDSYSASARSGSITQLFYNINFLHDWFYDAGFNEAARNGQKLNFGRGGLEADDMKAQSGDFQSFNNANMLTPADGQRSRMRMYNFPNLANTLDVQAPAGIASKLRLGVSQTGIRNFDITSDIVIATFTAGPTTCTITNAAALAGKIAMFDFDNTDGTNCAFSTRVARIHATSAAAALMVYSQNPPPPSTANSVANITGFNATHTKPIGVISWNAAAPIKAQLAVPNTVTARLLRKADRDGSLDNQIVFHEWGHFISNRLIGNASGLINQQGGSMGEGWGDFLAMLLTVRENDTTTPSNATWGGVYSLATYATSGVPYDGTANHGYYLGIRRTPYSTDMVNYNALTFRHIMDGQSAPAGPPIAWNPLVPNSEVHNAGEVWTTMLWECYAALLRDTQGAMPRLTFSQAQDRMKQYLVASLAMTPSSPTFLEARDAVLAAAYATDITDYALFWSAFAKRGAGLYAVAPDRYSGNHAGVVESFDAVPEIVFVNQSLNDSVASCDNDGVLDSGDTGKLTVSIKNIGTSVLVNTVATVTSSTPGVSFPNGNTFPLPASDPYATVSGSLNVALAAGIAGAQQLDFQ
ncbi:MAG TPA: M36 family metallopeptidase, partial [Thermoanaerobaculia bacterium]